MHNSIAKRINVEAHGAHLEAIIVLLGAPRLVYVHEQQVNHVVVHRHGLPGCPRTRKSTSAGIVMMHGRAVQQSFLAWMSR